VVSDDQTTIVAVDYFKVYQWDTSNLSLRNEFSSTQFAPNTSIASVGSPNENLLLLGKVTESDQRSILFYNTSTSTIEKEYKGNVDVGSSLQCSSDHKFVIIKERGTSRLVKLEADNTMTQKITTSHENLFFHPDDNTMVITGSELERAQGAVFVQDRETGSVIENIATPVMTIMGLDVQSDIAFGPLRDGSGEYVAFDYKNQKVLVHINGLITSEPMLSGNYLYSFQGVRLRLK
jgi:hypothetical protein